MESPLEYGCPDMEKVLFTISIAPPTVVAVPVNSTLVTAGLKFWVTSLKLESKNLATYKS